MSLLEMSADRFDELMSRPGILAIDVRAEWCKPCQIFSADFEAVAEMYPDHVFAKLDITNEQDMMIRLGVRQIPTLIIYRNGRLLYHKPATPSRESLERLIQQAEQIDLNRISAQPSGSNPADLRPQATSSSRETLR